EKIEDRPQVHIEPLGSLPRENFYTAGQVVNSGLSQSSIVGRGARTDVAVWTIKSTRQDGRIAARINSGHGIELTPIPIRTIERSNRASIVQEGIGIANICLETELVGNLFFSISIIIDVNFIEDIVTE